MEPALSQQLIDVARRIDLYIASFLLLFAMLGWMAGLSLRTLRALRWGVNAHTRSALY